jgi:hypothetical protein
MKQLDDSSNLEYVANYAECYRDEIEEERRNIKQSLSWRLLFGSFFVCLLITVLLGKRLNA